MGRMLLKLGEEEIFSIGGKISDRGLRDGAEDGV